MKLERATHVLESNQAKMRMSRFTEQIPSQIAAGINRLGDGGYTFYSIYPLPEDTEYDDFPYPDEWIQATGVAPGRLTVETRRLDSDNVYNVYTIGHATAASESEETEAIHSGDNTYLVRPSEILSSAEAIELFQHYYDHHAVLDGFHLRQHAEFAVPADTDQAASENRASISNNASPTSPSVAKAANAPKQSNVAETDHGMPPSGGN